MSEDPSGTIASEEEIEAALAEADRANTDIPSLDDDQDSVVPIPVESGVSGPARPPEPVAPRAADRVVVAPETGPDEERESRSSSSTGLQKLGRLGAMLYLAADTTLWALNRPFWWMSADAKQLTGILAAVTVIMSVLAMLLLPWIAPPDDVISTIQRQAAEVEQAP